MKLIIVGGVAGGASAATRARRLSEQAEILMIERGPDVSFANCGLPYHIGEIIPERSKLLVTTAEKLRERFRLDVRTLSEVVSIDRARKSVSIRDLKTGNTYNETYDKLVLAPGASPIQPSFAGVDLPGVFILRTLDDTDRIKKVVDQGAKRAIIVGAGFIGLELAENLVHRGLAVTLVELSKQILGPFDAEMTTPIVATLQEKGVELLLGQSAESIKATNSGLQVRFSSGEERDTSLVILGIGVRPENQLATKAGLETGSRGGIKVNEHLQTSDPDIYAAGDAIETSDFTSGERTQVPLAGPANRQGRIAADNVFGRQSKYRGTQGTAIVGLFGKAAAMTGLTEKALLRLKWDYRKVYIHPAHHAGYYPGAEAMSLKLIFEPKTGKLLGAQGVGGEGVDKRIDVLAVAIQAGMTVIDLEEMELCYAPQFGSAKDPVNMLGFVGAGLVRGDHPQIAWETVGQTASKAILLDVRTPTEFGNGHIPGAINIPVDNLRDRLDELNKNQQIVVYCQVGQRGYLATRILLQHGYQVVNLSGGYKTYLLYQPVASR